MNHQKVKIFAKATTQLATEQTQRRKLTVKKKGKSQSLYTLPARQTGDTTQPETKARDPPAHSTLANLGEYLSRFLAF